MDQLSATISNSCATVAESPHTFALFPPPLSPAKVLNIFFLLFNFLAWVACCVSFGGVLAKSTTESALLGGSIDGKWYWNRVETDFTTLNFSDDDCDLVMVADCSKCRSGGRGLIAMQVFAFLGLLAVLVLSLIRVLGVAVSALEPTRRILFWEVALTGLNTFFFFLSVCIWGGTCFHEIEKIDDTKVTGTGFGYVIACFFFLIFNLVIIWNIRGDSSTHLGSSGGSDYTNESDASTTNYEAPTSYQYNSDPAAAAYAGTYNASVVPNAGQAENTNL